MRCEDIKKEMPYYDVVRELQMTAFPTEERFSMEEILRLSQFDHNEQAI